MHRIFINGYALHTSFLDFGIYLAVPSVRLGPLEPACMRMGRGKDLSGRNPSTEVGSGTAPGQAEGLEDRGSWQQN